MTAVLAIFDKAAAWLDYHTIARRLPDCEHNQAWWKQGPGPADFLGVPAEGAGGGLGEADVRPWRVVGELDPGAHQDTIAAQLDERTEGKT